MLILEYNCSPMNHGPDVVKQQYNIIIILPEKKIDSAFQTIHTVSE